MAHSDKKPYKCDICTTKRDASKLRRHILTHTSEKLHGCEICEKTFNQFDGLKLHMLSHSSKKQHLCEIIQKTFKYSSVKKQMLTHGGEKTT